MYHSAHPNRVVILAGKQRERVARHVVPVSKNAQNLTYSVNATALLCTTVCR
jgi:hypothetical protein